MVGCFQTILGKNKFQIQYEYGQSKDMSNGYLVDIILIWGCKRGRRQCFQYPEEGEGGLFVIGGDPFFE